MDNIFVESFDIRDIYFSKYVEYKKIKEKSKNAKSSFAKELNKESDLYKSCMPKESQMPSDPNAIPIEIPEENILEPEDPNELPWERAERLDKNKKQKNENEEPSEEILTDDRRKIKKYIKKIFNLISIHCHPDKNPDPKLNKAWKQARKYCTKDKLPPLVLLCKINGIDAPIDDFIIDQISSEIDRLDKKITELKNHVAYKWVNEFNDSQRDQIKTINKELFS